MRDKPLILAMDIATQAAVCSGFPGQVPEFETVKFHGDDRLQVAASALRWVSKLTAWDDDKPDVAYLEKPMPFGAARGQSNATTLIRLNSLYDIIGGALLLMGVRVIGVDVQTVRGAFIGVRALDGDQAKKRAKIICDLMGWPTKNKDEADAAAVWYWGCMCEAPKLSAIVHPGMHAKAASIHDPGPYKFRSIPPLRHDQLP